MLAEGHLTMPLGGGRLPSRTIGTIGPNKESAAVLFNQLHRHLHVCRDHFVVLPALVSTDGGIGRPLPPPARHQQLTRFREVCLGAEFGKDCLSTLEVHAFSQAPPHFQVGQA